MALGQAATLLVQTGYFVLIARLLQVEQYGVFVGVMVYVTLLSQFGALGSGLILVRQVSRDRSRFREYWGNFLLTLLPVGTLLALFVLGMGSRFLSPESRSILVYVALSECLFSRVSEGAGQVFQALEEFRLTALATLVPNLGRLLLAGLLMLHFGRTDLVTWARLVLVVSAGTGLLSFLAVTRFAGLPRFSFRSTWRHLGEGFGFAFASSTTSAYNDLDKAMLNHYGLSAATGIYTLAYRVVDMSCTPIRSIHAAAFPRFCQRGAEGLEHGLPLARSILRRTLPYALLAAAVLALAAPVLPYVAGGSFRGSVTALRWLCLLPVFRSLHLSAGDMLTGAGFQRYRTGSQMLAALLNALLNVLLIPALAWRGAALGSLLTDGLLAGMNWMLIAWLVRRQARQVLPVPV